MRRSSETTVSRAGTLLVSRSTDPRLSTLITTLLDEYTAAIIASELASQCYRRCENSPAPAWINSGDAFLRASEELVEAEASTNAVAS